MSNLLTSIKYLDRVTVRTTQGEVTGRATCVERTTGHWSLRLEGEFAGFATATESNVVAVDKTQPIEPPAPQRDSYWDLQRDPIYHFGAY